MQAENELLYWLSQIAACGDKPEYYDMRENFVIAAVADARAVGLAAGYRIDPAEPEWPVAYIELPTGQVSWHLPQHKQQWDGHTTEEKWARVRAYLAN